ncbi:aspartyl/asparaginyl beta-hydroxylase isoform X5 [Sardina pilchardus]|uniref:aspartyl/asparaginyl beta-hydroxylase isoform X5 n=1 Tax=Sardina pilchardus TaxID=27697 RepID=UPI002E0E0D5B
MAETYEDGNAMVEDAMVEDAMVEDAMVEDTEAPSPPPPPAAISKNGKKAEGNSIFSWIFVLALLGAWTAVGVVWFDIVDYDTVVGTLVPYDIDGDGHLGLEDAKVLLGLKEKPVARETPPHTLVTDKSDEQDVGSDSRIEAEPTVAESEFVDTASSEQDLFNIDSIVADAGLSHLEQEFTPFDPTEASFDSLPQEENPNTIDTTGELVVESSAEETEDPRAPEDMEGATQSPEPAAEIPQDSTAAAPETTAQSAPQSEPQDTTQPNAEETPTEVTGKKKKPKMFNKFDKTIKSELDAAEKLRKKGKAEEALRAFEGLVQKYPHSPRSRYGKAQSEDDVAEKLRSNDLLLKAVNSYKEAAELPEAPVALIKAALKRRADRQQFLGRMRGSLATLQLLVQTFPDDIALQNDLGVAYLLIGDNKAAKQVYEEVLVKAPSDGFAMVHYGFILKSENKIAESIPYLRGGLESEAAGTDDGRFYFHLGDALQRVGDQSAYEWYERGHKRGHFASVWQRSLYNVNGLRAQPWWTAKESGYTDLVKTLERNWMTIRDEALSVMNASSGLFVAEDENLREKGDWGQFTLWQQGRKVASSCRSVPKTCALLDRYPEATSCKRGQIKFSVMQPGTHVWPHTGPTNCRLRMHLGLVIPRDGCRIRCTDHTRGWEEGKVIIFDDSFEHEVWQDADSYRLIFIVDVWHPELSQTQRQTLSPI